MRWDGMGRMNRIWWIPPIHSWFPNDETRPDLLYSTHTLQHRITSLPRFLFWQDYTTSHEIFLTTSLGYIFRPFCLSRFPSTCRPIISLGLIWIRLGITKWQSFTLLQSWTCHRSSPTPFYPNFPFMTLIYTFFSLPLYHYPFTLLPTGNCLGCLHINV
jgi:hypothetical protein